MSYEGGFTKFWLPFLSFRVLTENEPNTFSSYRFTIFHDSYGMLMNLKEWMLWHAVARTF